jgi:hypothetical protein
VDPTLLKEPFGAYSRKCLFPFSLWLLAIQKAPNSFYGKVWTSIGGDCLREQSFWRDLKGLAQMKTLSKSCQPAHSGGVSWAPWPSSPGPCRTSPALTRSNDPSRRYPRRPPSSSSLFMKSFTFISGGTFSGVHVHRKSLSSSSIWMPTPFHSRSK